MIMENKVSKCIFTIIICISIFSCGNKKQHLNRFIGFSDTSQIGKVDELGNKLFFNILNHHPDSSVYGFVERYFPSFTKPAVKGGWTSYPLGAIVPLYDTTIHSLRFKKHPYFEAKFQEGILEFFTLENKNQSPGITDLQILFIFDNYQDAHNAFQGLCDSFSKFSKTQKSEISGRKIIAHYSDLKDYEDPFYNEIILLPDELNDGWYKIIFRLWPHHTSDVGL
jgi:hypothetical protein